MAAKYTLSQAVLVFALIVPDILAQSPGPGDPVYEYCNGDGSICEAMTDLSRTCVDATGEEYYPCICASGYIPAMEACNNCLLSGNMTAFSGSTLADACEEEDIDIAPIPSSILSQQEERNETMTMPDATETRTSATSDAYAFPTTQPFWTATIDGEPEYTVSLILSQPSPTDGATGLVDRSRLGWQSWGVAGLVAGVVALW